MFHKYIQFSAKYYTFSTHPLVTIATAKIMFFSLNILDKLFYDLNSGLAKHYTYNKYKSNNTQV